MEEVEFNDMELLVQKYRPRTLDELVLTSGSKDMIRHWLKSGTTKNLLLSGPAGIGKTSLAQIIASELECDTLFFPCSDDSSKDTMRTKVSNFCQMEAIENIKIVILDEFDACRADAQSVLRNPIERESDDTRFIITCNNVNAIIDPIRSRCLELDVQYTIKEVIERVVVILNKEHVKFTMDNLKLFINEVVNHKFPAIRDIIKILEAWTYTGELKEIAVNSDVQKNELIIQVLSKLNNPIEAYRTYVQGESLFNRDYFVLGTLMFDHFAEISDVQSMAIVASGMINMEGSTDPRISFFAIIDELSARL